MKCFHLSACLFQTPSSIIPHTLKPHHLQFPIMESYPYKVDYNDHFETPLEAYKDISPLLECIAEKINETSSSLLVYDPFYCNGQTKVLFNRIGYKSIIHEKRDFYKDVENEQSEYRTEYFEKNRARKTK